MATAVRCLIALALAVLSLSAAGAQADLDLFARWARFTPENSGLADLRVTQIIEAYDGTMWFVHPGAVSRFDGRAWQTFPATVTLPEDAGSPVDDVSGVPWAAFGVVAVPSNGAVMDSRGAVWVATDAGVFRQAPDTWENGTPAYRGMANYAVQDVLRDSYGVLWIAAYDPVSAEGSFSGLDPIGQWLFFNAEAEPGLASHDVTALAEDRFGGLWAGTVESGVSRLFGGAWQTWDAAGGALPDDRVIDLFAIDGGAVVAVATRGGVARYDVGAAAWDAWFTPPEGFELAATAYAEAGRVLLCGVEYVAGEAGPVRAEWRRYSVRWDGEVETDVPVYEPLRSIAWRVRDDKVFWVVGDEVVGNIALALDDPQHVAVDSTGMVWAGTAGGPVRYDPDTFQAVRFNSQNSGLADESAHLLTEDNGLWVFGTDLVYVITYRPEPPARPMLTFSVSGEQAQPAPALPLMLPVSAETLTFYVDTSAWWPAPSLAYRVRLDGELTIFRADDPAAHRATVAVDVAALAAGDHTFCVAVSNPLLDLSPETCVQFATPQR
jgi:hypothetical protein